MAKSENHPQLSEVALEIFKAKTIHLRNRKAEANAKDAFQEANVFLSIQSDIESGKYKVELPRPAAAAPTVVVVAWNQQEMKPELDEFGKVVTREVLADINAYAPGLPNNHPINEAYIKGRLQMNLPINKRFKGEARQFAREAKTTAVMN